MRDKKVWISICLLGLGAGLAWACAKPAIIRQGEREYSVAQRGEELFVYVDYLWGGGKFEDAKKLERDFAAWGVEKGIFVYAMGRFPTLHEWRLGFVAKAAPSEQEFQLREIKTEALPAGRWATMSTRGNVDYLFRYWRKLQKRLEKDGLAVDGAVVEVYPDLSAKDVPVDQVRGEIRYRLAD
jgi:hypothetical protein